MPEVYIVTSGDYSAYQIRAVFSTRKEAEAYAAWIDAGETWINMYGPEASVECWKLGVPDDAADDSVVMAWVGFWHSRMGRTRSSLPEPDIKIEQRPVRTSQLHTTEPHPDIGVIRTFQTDKEAAIKIVSDWRAKWIAQELAL